MDICISRLHVWVLCTLYGGLENGILDLRTLTKNVLFDIWLYFDHEMKFVSCLGVVLKTDLTSVIDDLYMYKLMFKKNTSFEKLLLE